MIAKEIIEILERLAPPAYQEHYDNSGLLIGARHQAVSGITICLDVTEKVIDDAIENGSNMIVAHHPLIFSGLKRINGNHWVERCIIKAIKNDILIYAIHTNLDNVSHGVNKKICDKLGLIDTAILSPKNEVLSKLVAFVPNSSTSKVLEALYNAGAGEIGNYDHCSFTIEGQGNFRPGNGSDPVIGTKDVDESVTESRIEVVFENYKTQKIIDALKKAHPYEEVAYYLQKLQNTNQDIGSGMVGLLKSPMESNEFLKLVKKQLNTDSIRYTAIHQHEVHKIAVCGGSGSFLLNKAKSANADVFITADFKYHEFFEADNDLIIADIGHYESEQFTKELIFDYLSEKLTNIALRFTEAQTNPLKYL